MADLARPTRAGLVVQAVETLRLVAGRSRRPSDAYCRPNDDESGRKALTVVGTVILRDVHPMCTDVSASGSADAATP